MVRAGVTVRWKPGAVGVKKLDPEACEKELNRIHRQVGITPAAIVDAAADKDSPLHDGFTWDDSEAARKHRLQEAQSIIRAIVYVEPHPDGSEREIRCFVNVKEESAEEIEITTPGKYVPMRAALSDPRYREQVLSNALKDAQAYAAKYRDLEEVSKIIRAIDATVRQYEREHATV